MNVSLKKFCLSPNPWSLWMWSLEIGSLQMQIKLRWGHPGVGHPSPNTTTSVLTKSMKCDNTQREDNTPAFWSRDWSDGPTSHGTPETASNQRNGERGLGSEHAQGSVPPTPWFQTSGFLLCKWTHLFFKLPKKKHCQDDLLSKRIPICVIGKHSPSHSDIETWARKNWLNKSLKLLRPQDSNIHFLFS